MDPSQRQQRLAELRQKLIRVVFLRLTSTARDGGMLAYREAAERVGIEMPPSDGGSTLFGKETIEAETAGNGACSIAAVPEAALESRKS
jgi:hypothetical protein